MLRRVCLAAYLLLVSALAAQTVPPHNWADLGRLRSGRRGNLIDVVLFPRDAQSSVSEQRCRLFSVTPTTLTCIENDSRTQRLVFPETAVAAVYRIKTGWSYSVPKVVLGTGAGLTLGCLITDEKCNVEFALLGATIGALNGLRWGARPTPLKFVCVYQKSPQPPPALPSPATSDR